MTFLLSLGHIHEQTVDEALSNFFGIVSAAGFSQLGVFAQRTQLLSYVQGSPQISNVNEVLLAPSLRPNRGRESNDERLFFMCALSYSNASPQNKN